jgi:glycosyltransferase involved in cell wall biosynthesis
MDPDNTTPTDRTEIVDKTKPSMKIVFAISGKNLPSSRYRILAFLPYLRRLGHKCRVLSSFPPKYDFYPWLGFRPSQWLKRLVRRWHLLTTRVTRFDVFFLERELFDNDAWDFETQFRKASPRFVLDIDDGVFLRYPEKIERLARMSDLIIAGNRFLKEHLEPFNSNIVVIPTCVDIDVFVQKEERTHPDQLCVIGWMGTTFNLNYLKLVAPALRNLASRVEFELRLIAPESEPLAEIDLAGVNVQFVKWDADTEVQQLSACDIGMMPLFAEDDWNKYKCALKLVQYMSIGIVGVASPVGVNADIIQHGENGFVCSDVDEWEDVLFRLVQDPELRIKVGNAARKTIVDEYSIQANLPLLVESLQTTIAQSPIR